MNKGLIAGIAAGIIVAGGLGFAIYKMLVGPAGMADEFIVGADVSGSQFEVGQSFAATVTVNDTINEPSTTPWTLCGEINATGPVSPSSRDVAVIQNPQGNIAEFPQGSRVTRQSMFSCDDEGDASLVFNYRTSRKVTSCDAASLIAMQNDPDSEEKMMSLGSVKCVKPAVPPQPPQQPVSDADKQPEVTAPELEGKLRLRGGIFGDVPLN